MEMFARKKFRREKSKKSAFFDRRIPMTIVSKFNAIKICIGSSHMLVRYGTRVLHLSSRAEAFSHPYIVNPNAWRNTCSPQRDNNPCRNKFGRMMHADNCASTDRYVYHDNAFVCSEQRWCEPPRRNRNPRTVHNRF